MHRIVLFGATGYTGRLTAKSLAASGRRAILCGRSADKLSRLATELGGLETAVADASDPASLGRLLDAGDVLVTTVGPFERFGAAALEACIKKKAVYIDSTGEPPFIRQVFERWGPKALGRCALIPACGFDYAPGNLAGALALRQAGSAVSRVEIFYVLEGAGSGGWASGGTLASAAGAAFQPWFRYAEGRLVADRPAARQRSFQIGDRSETAVSIAGSEHFTLPTLAPALRGVDVFLSVGPFAPLLRVGALWTQGVALVPGARAFAAWMAGAFTPRGGIGPSARQRERSGFVVVARALDSRGELLAEVEVAGPNGYEFTARILAWAASRAAGTGVAQTGALGPVQAFGLDPLLEGCAHAGVTVS